MLGYSRVATAQNLLAFGYQLSNWARYRLLQERIAIRPACITDVEAIYAIMAEVACRIPVNLSTAERAKAMKKQIKDYCGDGLSIVAIDEKGACRLPTGSHNMLAQRTVY
jgi:hypothetical protein